MKVEIGGIPGLAGAREGYVQVDAYGKPDILADIRALPFRHSLQEIYMSHVLEHLPDADIVAALKSCRVALVENGLLDIYVPDLAWVLRKFLKAAPGVRWALWNVRIFGSQENEGQFHKTGFTVNRLQTCLVAAGFRRVEAKRCKREITLGMMEVHAQAFA